VSVMDASGRNAGRLTVVRDGATKL